MLNIIVKIELIIYIKIHLVLKNLQGFFNTKWYAIKRNQPTNQQTKQNFRHYHIDTLLFHIYLSIYLSLFTSSIL